MAFGGAAVLYSPAPLYIQHALHTSAFKSAHLRGGAFLLHLLSAFPFHDGMINALVVGRSWESLSPCQRLDESLDDRFLIPGLVRGLLE